MRKQVKFSEQTEGQFNARVKYNGAHCQFASQLRFPDHPLLDKQLLLYLYIL
jgi:hypothetical protein